MKNKTSLNMQAVGMQCKSNTYGATLVIKKHLQKMNVAKMMMLRWMCRKCRIRNDSRSEMVNVAPIEDRIRKNQLECFCQY